MTERCERTELLVDDCAHCRGHKSIEEQVADERIQLGEARTRWFNAIYPGKCAGCGTPFDEGNLIHGVPGHAGWVAECCAEDVR